MSYVILNTVFFILTIITNGLFASGILPSFESIGDVSHTYDTLIVPPDWAFSIWGEIYFLLLLFIIFQYTNFFKININYFVESIDSLFILSCIFNMAWIIIFCIGSPLSIFISNFIILSLLYILYNIQQITTNRSQLIEYFSWTTFVTDVPFSLYFGWIILATILNISSTIQAWFPSHEQFYLYIMYISISDFIFSINLYINNNYITSTVYIYALISLIYKMNLIENHFLLLITSLSFIFQFLLLLNRLFVNYKSYLREKTIASFLSLTESI